MRLTNATDAEGTFHCLYPLEVKPEQGESPAMIDPRSSYVYHCAR